MSQSRTLFDETEPSPAPTPRDDDARDRHARPLRVMFIHTFMPVGGAETLLVNLIRRLDRNRFAPEVCCLKYPGPLGEVLARETPLFSHLLANKYDLRVLPRLSHSPMCSATVGTRPVAAIPARARAR